MEEFLELLKDFEYASENLVDEIASVPEISHYHKYKGKNKAREALIQYVKNLRITAIRMMSQ